MMEIGKELLKKSVYGQTVNWLSIETAPRDGTWILLAGGQSAEHEESVSGKVVVGFWNSKFMFSEAWSFAHYNDDFISEYFEPTHWVPLPEPPK